MWSKEYFTPFGRLLSLKDSFGSRKKTPLQEITSPLLEKPLPNDEIERFWALVAGFCCESRFEEFASSEIKWPPGLQPARSFKTKILSLDDLRGELQEALILDEAHEVPSLYFGFRWVSSMIENPPIVTGSSDNAMLFVSEEIAKNAVILSARRSARRDKWEAAATVYSPAWAQAYSRLQVPPRKFNSLFSNTAELAIKCAEIELRKIA